MYLATITDDMTGSTSTLATLYPTTRAAWDALADACDVPAAAQRMRTVDAGDGAAMTVQPEGDPREHESDTMTYAVDQAWCEVFALCENEATSLRAHPILRHVPACKRCTDKLASL